MGKIEERAFEVPQVETPLATAEEATIYKKG